MIGAEEIEAAVGVLRRGGLVAFPTETVYGLGCDAESRDAMRRLYEVKRRPTAHPVIVHLGHEPDLSGWSRGLTPEACKLTERYWPGPLTVVVPRGPRVLDEVTGGHDTVGLRVPGQPVALALLDAFGGGIAAPSANRFGRVSPTTATDVRADLADDVDFVLDGGPCAVGVESTIVDCSRPDPVILRVGAVSREQVEELLGQEVRLRIDGETPAPGTLPAHYAPDARIVLVTLDEIGERASALLATGRRVGLLVAAPPPLLPPGLIVLEPPGDVDEYARVLYARLREADRRGLDVLLAVPPADVGLGSAVADRLRRASA